MTPLFDTHLTEDKNQIAYHVFFSDNKYHFQPDHEQGNAISFSLIREYDEWKPEGNIDNTLKDEAIARLEQYLLAQL